MSSSVSASGTYPDTHTPCELTGPRSPTIPAFFWSLPDHYDLAAVNCARVHSTTHGHHTTPRDLLSDTMMLRASLLGDSVSTAWVGHLPIEYGLTDGLGFMAEHWIANPRRETGRVRRFDDMPAAATFQCDAWGMYICYVSGTHGYWGLY